MNQMAADQTNLISSSEDVDDEEIQSKSFVTEENSEIIREALRNSIASQNDLPDSQSPAPVPSDEASASGRLIKIESPPFLQENRISSSTPIERRSRHNSFTRSEGQNGSPNVTSSKYPAEHSVSAKVRDPTILDYLYTELRRGYDLGNDEQRYRERREKFYIFLKIPVQLEKFLWYGFLQCADAFLFMFTLLPIRFVLAIWFSVSRSLRRTFSDRSFPSQKVLQPAEICDLLRGCVVIVAAIAMNYVDMPMLYHIIKSQSVIKLYMIFNILEVSDKLFSCFGQDILDALFWTATESGGRKRDRLGVIPHLALASLYVFLHTVLVLLQATTLNVAINSKNKALLTIMMSNNFVELKSMVFKKFEKGNLFHMSCSDVRERFHYLILLLVVVVQTLKEYNWSGNHIFSLLTDSFCILGAEVAVDWLKHCFITRFNEISPDVYSDYNISLAYDLTSSKLKSAFSDHSDIVSRRMGFIPLPLCVLVFRVISGSCPSLWNMNGFACLLLGYLCLSCAKCWINILMLGTSCELIDKHRSKLEKKTPLVRTCSSLPSSRHASLENIHKAVTHTNSQSTPHTPIPSQSSSLADITAQAHMMQEDMESSMIMSDSQVSLVSMDIGGLRSKDVSGALNPLNVSAGSTGAYKRKSILRHGSLGSNDSLKRRVSLQDSKSGS